MRFFGCLSKIQKGIFALCILSASAFSKNSTPSLDARQYFTPFDPDMVYVHHLIKSQKKSADPLQIQSATRLIAQLEGLSSGEQLSFKTKREVFLAFRFLKQIQLRPQKRVISNINDYKESVEFAALESLKPSVAKDLFRVLKKLESPRLLSTRSIKSRHPLRLGIDSIENIKNALNHFEFEINRSLDQKFTEGLLKLDFKQTQQDPILYLALRRKAHEISQLYLQESYANYIAKQELPTNPHGSLNTKTIETHQEVIALLNQHGREFYSIHHYKTKNNAILKSFVTIHPILDADLISLAMARMITNSHPDQLPKTKSKALTYLNEMIHFKSKIPGESLNPDPRLLKYFPSLTFGDESPNKVFFTFESSKKWLKETVHLIQNRKCQESISL